MQDSTIQVGNKAIINKHEPAQTTYFFERQDGSVIAVTGAEAWALYQGRNQVVGFRNFPPKHIGTSDGKLYHAAVAESHRIFRETSNLEEAQKVLRKGFEDELTAARGKITPPPNYDTVDKNGNPTSISALL